MFKKLQMRLLIQTTLRRIQKIHIAFKKQFFICFLF